MRGEDTGAAGAASRRGRWAASLTVLPWCLLALAIADWVALRTGALGHPAGWLAALVAVTGLAFLLRLAQLAVSLLRRRRPVGAPLAETLALAGVIAALAAGSLNWLYGLQGYVVLHDGEAAPLHGGSHLQDFQGGPLSDLGEMDLVLGLEQVELVPAGGGTFYPESHLVLEGGAVARDGDGGEGGDGGDVRRRLTVSPRSSAAAGSLRFHQGAFGFAPRIVIQHRDDTVFDRTVPFTTERHAAPAAGDGDRDGDGPPALAYAGHFTVAEHDLELRGEVDLASLDAGLRGHATLRLEVLQGGRRLGRGELLPGRFAELADGWRVGFAGLSRWSEIDVSRRTYGAGVLVGAALALIGLLLWPLAGRREW